MTAENPDSGTAEPGFSFSDKRRIDPETGEVRTPQASGRAEPQGSAGSEAPAGADTPTGVPGSDADQPEVQIPEAGDEAEVLDDSTAGQAEGEDAEVASGLSADAQLAADRLADLQRLNAEYAAYRMRAERDQARARDEGVQTVVEALFPVLDEIKLADENGDVTGPFETHVTKLVSTLERLGVQQFGEPGEEFDPNVHDALMQQPSEEVENPTVFMVMQPGYRIGERVVRAARVGVHTPAE
ncbi:nucleotide exchange factor GrpE [Brevibacterium daeguense]|uniref:Protein GrpE n=1 Tax=Brevibacterium daeguense TaxID=909936 RepID=A0ABP8EKL7_9MICO